jgi:hypothetical protein
MGDAKPVVVGQGQLGCGHNGLISVTVVSTALTIGGKGVLLEGQEVGLPFLPAAPPTAPVPPQCTHITTDQVPLPAPCVTKAVTSGTATKLTVGKVPVLLGSAKGTTTTAVPKAVPPTDSTWSVSAAGQSRLTAT